MAYRPRQVTVRAFEVAAELVRTLERERWVILFLNAYARDFNRAAKTAHPARYRELVEMITREALLAAATHIEAAIPQKLGYRAKAKLRPSERKAQAELLAIFREEFYSALAQALGWNAEEAASFRRDLDLYERLSLDEPRPPKQKKLAAVVEGPFVDRVGLLLDPSLLEKARRAAAKFQSQLEAAADEILKRVFSSRYWK